MNLIQSIRVQAFDRLYHEYDVLCHEIARRQGLSDSAYDVLRAILVLGEGCTQTNIYQNGFFNKQTIHSAVKKLIADGILYAQSGKGRETGLYFTAKGKQLAAEKILPIENAEREVYDSFSEEEYRMLLRLTTQYLDTFRSKVQSILEEEA